MWDGCAMDDTQHLVWRFRLLLLNFVCYLFGSAWSGLSRSGIAEMQLSSIMTQQDPRERHVSLGLCTEVLETIWLRLAKSYPPTPHTQVFLRPTLSEKYLRRSQCNMCTSSTTVTTSDLCICVVLRSVPVILHYRPAPPLQTEQLWQLTELRFAMEFRWCEYNDCCLICADPCTDASSRSITEKHRAGQRLRNENHVVESLLLHIRRAFS